MLAFRVLLFFIICLLIFLIFSPPKINKKKKQLIWLLVALCVASISIFITYQIILKYYLVQSNNTHRISSKATSVVQLDNYDVKSFSKEQINQYLANNQASYELELVDIVDEAQMQILEPMLLENHSLISSMKIRRTEQQVLDLIVNHLQSFKKIRELSIEKTHGGIKYLDFYGLPESLHLLSLSENRMSTSTIQNIKNLPKNLKILILSQNKLNNQSLVHLSNILGDNLEYLVLSNNYITNIQALSLWLEQSTLHEIDLSYNNINDETLFTVLNTLSKCKTLKYINLNRNNFQESQNKLIINWFNNHLHIKNIQANNIHLNR